MIFSALFGNINKGMEEYRAAAGAILIDVREDVEFASGHIPDAVNAPLSIIESADLPKDQPLFLYCFRGSRSKRAADILARKGYTQVKSIGGIASYRGTIVSGK
ncbi:MAG: rhodanese-like domain-containing protein [Clostridia bacterium]|nr:rhodanese-like domain-containing protein [Clostridia bacterium]